MKTFTLKASLIMLCFSFFSFFAEGAIPHGSMKGTDVPMYAQGSPGGNIAEPKAVALNFKVVTKGSKTWAFLQFTGTPGINTGASWQTQLRYWSATNAKTENNLDEFRDGTAKVVMGSTIKTIPDPVRLTFFQDLNPGGFSETLLLDYDITAKNSLDPGDATPPIVTACDVIATETNATLTITGADNSGDVFYHIADAVNGVDEMALSSSYKLNNLSAATTYNLTITPIDFSGNEGTPLQKSFTTSGLIQILSGIAKEIKFVFKSTTTQLEYYYEFTNPTKKFRDAFIKITPAGGVEFELKPTLSSDSTYAYGITTDARIAGKVLTFNCGYFIYAPGEPVWGDYVVDNKMITSGPLMGNPIKHLMGGAIALEQAETTPPVLNSVTLQDVTSQYVKLNIDGSDNSGTVYYEISGAKQNVNAFRTGNYYLKEIEGSKIYTLDVVAKDMSGNVSASKEVKVKTMKARSNIKDNLGMNYNNTTTTTSGGELVSIIQYSGNTLTIGCTTASPVITNAAWRDRLFSTPTVVIDGTSYPLTLDEDSTTATRTFTDIIGSVSIEAGASFQIRWSVFWTGQFFTGTFTYTIGDGGETDVVAPTVPVLSLDGTSLSWPACIDLLSGVKWYLVQENGQPEVKIFDLGDPTISYTLSNPENQVIVKAVDFVGNESSASLITSSTDNISQSTFRVFPNPATDVINISGETPAKVVVYSLQGKQLSSHHNTNKIYIGSLSRGLYLVQITSNTGLIKSEIIEVL